jgi:hypothetical protein
MPERKTIEQAQQDKREGKAPSTQAGEFVREEVHHIREGKHGARSTKQAIAIGLSKARKAGVKIPAASERGASQSSKAKARAKAASGTSTIRRRKRPTGARSRAMSAALRDEGHSAASPEALARQARSSARERGPAARSAAAKKAARTRARNR